MSADFTIGGLFAGYGGLDLAVSSVFPDACPAWFSQYDPDGGKRQAPSLADEVEHLLPTYTPQAWDAWTARMRAEHGNGNGHGKSLHVEVARLLPTPRATDGAKGGPNQRGSSGDPTPSVADVEGAAEQRFGQYAPAIARWEALTRPAPPPTEPTGKNGAHRLSPRFVEHLMGLPDGWVTDVPGITRNDMLKALGNGVVPQQAAEAIRWLTATAADRLGTTKAVAS